ncbi:MAG: type II toxin-antitoxin system HicA family toxin [Nanoarchaeota archaeon]|nr:type II toxin-antitoxin system HicA family toxin [Nanoarchaeota archaeon]
MSKLPVLSGRELIKILEKRGWEFDHQTGSHITLRYKYPPFTRVTIPNHKELKKGTLLSIMNDIGLKRENFE